MKENLYTITQTRIKIDSWDDEIKIDLFGDIHRDAPNCDEDRWKTYLKNAKNNGDNHYYLGLGDYSDMASFNERKSIKNGSLHETTVEALDMLAERNNRTIASEMMFMKGKLLGLISGNHRWTFENGKTSDDDLCERLQCKNLGWLTYHTLSVDLPKRMASVSIVACHGLGGGKLIGTSINKVNDLKVIFPSADIYVMGHDHQRLAVPTTALFPLWGGKDVKIKQKRQWLIRSGSFQKSYDPDTSGYSISKLMRPADIGIVTVKIKFHRDQTKADNIITDIRVDY